MLKTVTIEEAVKVIRDAGILGAGGAGFPAYVKYRKPTEIFIGNFTESEPGYFADKLLAKEHAREFCDIFRWMRATFGYKQFIIAYKAKDEALIPKEFQDMAAKGEITLKVVPPLYKMGDEKYLTPEVTGREIPQGKIAPDVGVTMNNTETLWNMYKAFTKGEPVTTKFFQMTGEVPAHDVFEAPVGAYVTDICKVAGYPTEDKWEGLKCVDGGPLLGDVIGDGTYAAWKDYGIGRMSNGLLFIAPEKFTGRGKHYPLKEYRKPTHVVNIESKIHRVKIPLKGRYGEAAVPVVKVGDHVKKGQLIAKEVTEKLSVPAHASINGTVKEVTATHIRIEQ